MAKRALVTGATGFTGGHLARRLRRDGWDVTALVRKNSNWQSLHDSGCTLVLGDLSDKESCKKAAHGVTVIFHIAAMYRSEGSRAEFAKVNVEGTRNMLDAGIEAGIDNFIHCSTVGVHGEIDQPPADEQAPFKPGDDYQETKLEGEMLVKRYIDEGKINATIFRPVGMYGPGDRRFLKLFKMVKMPITPLIGRGNTLYHLTYIDDLIDGILLLAEKPEADGQTFILAGRQYTTLIELMQIIAHVLNKPLRIAHIPKSCAYGAAHLNEFAARLLKIKPLIYSRRFDFFIKDRAFNIEKAVTQLGYAPNVSLEEGTRRTAEWYKQNGML